jgi:hypothetical protein
MSHWIDEIGDVAAGLSARAKNILRNRVRHQTLFLEMGPEQIMALRNCGVKTLPELLALQKRLLGDRPAQQELFDERPAQDDVVPPVSRALPKPCRNVLEKHGWTDEPPNVWDLETVFASTYPRSSALRILADTKVDHWCETTGNERRERDELETAYLEFHDLPFAARLCGWDIFEAKKELRPLLSVIARVRSVEPESLQNEVDLLLPTEQRARTVVIRRTLPWGDSLKVIGNEVGLTRERIRQIEAKAIRFAQYTARAAQAKLKSITELSRSIVELGSELSTSRLIELIQEYGPDHESALTALLIVGSDDRLPDDLKVVAKAVETIASLPQNDDVTVLQHEFANGLSPETVRELRRISRNAGAVHITYAERKLGLQNEDSVAVLRELGFSEAAGDWFFNPLQASNKHNPIANCAGKIVSLSGPTKLDVVWEGATRHARRLKYTLAPPSVVKVVLEHAGFALDGAERVHGNGQRYELSGTEKAFVEAIEKQYKECASFWDLYEAIVLSGRYSLPSLSTVLLRTSPVVTVVTSARRTSLYGIAGRSVDESCIAQALERQPSALSSATLSHTLDGFLIQAAVTPWMLASGVLTLPSHSHVPEKTWKWMSGLASGTAVTSDMFLYGFSEAIADLGVTLGDEICFRFHVPDSQIHIQSGKGASVEEY